MLEDIFFNLTTASTRDVRDVVEVGIAEVHIRRASARRHHVCPRVVRHGTVESARRTNGPPHPPPADRISWLRENETSAISTATAVAALRRQVLQPEKEGRPTAFAAKREERTATGVPTAVKEERGTRRKKKVMEVMDEKKK